MPAHLPSPSAARPLQACAVVGAVLMGFIVLGHDGRRIAQIALLALPLLLWLAWPVRSSAMHRLRAAAVGLLALAFVLDGAARAWLLDAYQAAPDSAMVLGAAANTNARESAEYLRLHWRALALGAGMVALAAVLVARFVPRGARRRAGTPGLPRWALALMALLLLTSAVAYASKPWRRLHPALFWSHWAGSVQSLRAAWADQQAVRDAALARARAIAPVAAQQGPATVLLVITDSINRDNMALYGYGRPTTPRLMVHQAQTGDQMTVLRNAWSVDASTLPALRNLFHFGTPDTAGTPHAIALARAAGYKVWWIGNHDDLAVEQQHARLADVVDIVNRTPGRAAASLDGEVLDCVQEALQDPAERKLVVVHLMGAHPHYRLRFPDGANPFDDSVDMVERGLVEDGRSGWVRRFRHEYDAALLYHDFVVSELLLQARSGVRPGEYRAWMYLSDHGQEVGHASDRAGHSPATASGYRIPTVVWRNRQAEATPADAQMQPFRADWAGWTLMDLLQVQWPGQRPERNVLDARYRWEAPALPVQVESFSR